MSEQELRERFRRVLQTKGGLTISSATDALDDVMRAHQLGEKLKSMWERSGWEADREKRMLERLDSQLSSTIETAQAVLTIARGRQGEPQGLPTGESFQEVAERYQWLQTLQELRQRVAAAVGYNAGGRPRHLGLHHAALAIQGAIARAGVKKRQQNSVTAALLEEAGMGADDARRAVESMRKATRKTTQQKAEKPTS